MLETLPSGLRLLVDELPHSPVTSVQVWVEVGSADEGPGEEGAAHFVEHMLFKGTPRRGPGQVANEIEGLGGDVNAYTSFDHSVYHATVPATAWAQALEVLADMLQCSIFDPEEARREREVILDELRGGRDDPDLVLHEAVMAQVYPAHPYGRSIGGSPRAVAALEAPELLAFWRAHVHPARMVLSVAGAAPAPAVRALAERLFPPRAGQPRVWPPEEPEQRRRRSALRAGAFEEPQLALALRAVPDRHPDAAGLELLAAALGDGSTSHLGAELQVRRRLISASWAGLDAERQGGVLTFGCTPLRGRTLEAAIALAEGLREAAQGALPLAAVSRARARMLADALAEEESAEHRAWRRAFHLVHDGDPEAWLRDRAALEALTPGRLRALAAEYLRPERLTLGALLPPGDVAPEVLRRAVDEALRPRRAPVSRPAVVRELLPNGLTLVVEEVDTAPVVGLRLVGLGGQLGETRATAGLSELWARGLGAGLWSAQVLAERAELRGVELAPFSGRNTQGLRVDCAADRLEEGLELLALSLREPRFDPADHERAVAELLEEEALLQDKPEELAWREALRLLYGPHPYGLPPRGSAATLPRLGPAALRAHHRRFAAADNLVLAAAGPVDAGALGAELRRLLADLRPRGLPLRPRPAPAWPRRERALRRVVDRAQAHLVLAWPGARFCDPDCEALALAAAVLGGQGGRLFVELRDRRGLAYHVGAESSEAWDEGSISVSMSMDPERVDEGLEGLRAEVRRLAAEGPSPEELRRVQTFVLGMMVMGRQRVGARALDLALWERYGRPATQARELAEARLRAVTGPQLQAALAARLARPGVVVQVGPGEGA